MNNINISPRISVVIPCYNRESTISRAINSVLAQDFDNWELIIVDDGSDDESLNIIKKFTDQDLRINCYRMEKNSGAAAARNLGIKNSTTEYISLLDSDDWYEISFLRLSLEKISNSADNIGFIWSGIKFHYSSYIKKTYWTNSLSFNSYINFLFSLQIGTSAGITFKRNVFEAVGFFREDLPAAEDTEFFLRLSQYFDYDSIGNYLINIDKTGDDRLSRNYYKIAKAYNRFLPDHFDTINQYPLLQKKFYYKMMWLNYYMDNKRESRKYFKKLIFGFNLSIKTLFIFLIFELLPKKIAIKIHQSKGE